MVFALRALVVVSLVTAPLFAGCSSDRGAEGSREPKKRPSISVSELEVKPPALMVARPCDRPLVLVVDPAKVPAVAGPVKWNLSRYDVTDVDVFVTRDLAAAMKPFYREVTALKAGDPVPPGAMVADVRIDEVTTKVAGQFAFGSLTWAFAVRPDDAPDYLYSFAGTAQSGPERSVRRMMAGTFENAITDMLAGYAERKIHETCLSLPSSSSPPAEAGQTDL